MPGLLPPRAFPALPHKLCTAVAPQSTFMALVGPAACSPTVSSGTHHRQPASQVAPQQLISVTLQDQLGIHVASTDFSPFLFGV